MPICAAVHATSCTVLLCCCSVRTWAACSTASSVLAADIPPLLQTEDGLFVRALPSELLRKLNIVDTPGTNVIIDRQQRLTEEFVPRSDLVLFIMSADRPFTESEVLLPACPPQAAM